MKKLLMMSAALPLIWIGHGFGQTATSPSAAGADQIETIVVTAEKRQTNLQKTAASIAAVSGTELLRQGQTQLDQVMMNVGAVRLLEGEDGPTFYIRGVGTGVPSNIGDPEVNLNIDGIYQSEPEYSRGGLYDVNRIEVLRGPQGTLYGRNAVAGVVNIVTNDPTFDYGAGGSIGFGNYSLVQTQGYLNVPLADTLAARVAFGTENHDGYLSNGADDTDVQSARVKVLWRPLDTLKLVVTADDTHEGGAAEGEIQLNPPAGPPLEPWFRNAVALGNTFKSSDPWTAADPAGAARKADFWSIHAQLDWDLGFGTLTIIPSYRDYTYQCLNCWRSETDQNQTAAERQTTFEARLASSADSTITWLAGLYYLHSNTPTSGQNLGPNADSFTAASGNQVSEQGQVKYVAESYAAFGQATVPVTDWLRLTGGIRYNVDRKSETAYVLGESGVNGVMEINTCSTSQSPAIGGTYYDFSQCLFSTSMTSHAVTYTAGFEADVASGSMIYGKVSTGYKSGGFFQGAAPDTYNPEHLTSYEIGAKTRFLNNRLEINADAYYYVYHNYQINYISLINPTSAGIFGINTANAAGATLYGGEVEAKYLFTPFDEIDVSVYPLHSKFKTLVIRGCCGGTFTGDQLPFAPYLSINAGLEHSWELDGKGTVTARIETHFESPTWVNVEEPPGTRQPAYTKSNIYLTYDAPGHNWSVTGYIKNLENAPVLVNSQGGPGGLVAGDIAPPRTFGAQVSAKF